MAPRHPRMQVQMRALAEAQWGVVSSRQLRELGFTAGELRGMVHAALRRYLPGSQDRRSQLEADFQAHERADPRLPAPQYNAELLGYEIDALWREQRSRWSSDGRPYDVAIADFDRDRGRDRTLSRHGWRPVRVSDFEWEADRAAVLDDLYGLLGV